MKIDIAKIAFEKTVDYAKSLQSAKHFEDLLKTYIKWHNKGLFVDFSFNSSGASGLFGYYVRRYGASESILENLNPKFSREKTVKLNGMKEKYEKRERAEHDRRKTWIKIESDLLQYRKKLADMSDVKLSEGMAKLTEEVVGAGKNNAKVKMEKWEHAVKLVSNTKSRILHINRDISNNEKTLFKMCLDYYMSTTEELAKELFKTKHVKVQYKWSEWKEFLKNATENYSSYNVFKDNTLSDFERLILGVIKSNQFKFEISIYDTREIYTIHIKGVSIKHKGDSETYADYEQKNRVLNQKFDTLLLKNADFAIALKLHEDMTKEFPTEPFTKPFSQYIFGLFSRELIDEYNQLVEEGKKIRKARDERWSSKEEKPSQSVQLQQRFDFLTFEIVQKQNDLYYIALREIRYDDIIQSVSSEEYVLHFAEEKTQESKQDEEDEISDEEFDDEYVV